MIIDCHGHYTTVPAPAPAFRRAQLEVLGREGGAPPRPPEVGDDAIRESIEPHQLRLMDERGIDVTLLSPQASNMQHHVSDEFSARVWAEVSNDLVHRVVTLFPGRFAGVAQLPQTPGGPLDPCIAELRRSVEELGFVGCNLNPDPSGGSWAGPPMTDPYWFPLYEAMIELDVPAMIHVSASCNANAHTLGAHYLNADTAVFMQLLEGDLFARFPTLRLVIPHGGGAVPYHWGRYRGLADRLGRPALGSHLMRNLYFDTCVYHQAGIDLLFRVVESKNILFASEMLGAVRGIDPESGFHWDDTRRYIEALDPAPDRAAIFEANVRRVYPRLGAMLARSR
jgi:4-oxalmesaconate hydratase